MALPRSPRSPRKPSSKADDQPATRKMLFLVRDELSRKISSESHRLDGRFKGIDARFDEMEGRFKAIDARFDEMEGRFKAIDARFLDMEARFDRLEANQSRMMLLMEEQRADNRIVLEALQGLWQRVDSIDVRVTRLEQAQR